MQSILRENLMYPSSGWKTLNEQAKTLQKCLQTAIIPDVYTSTPHEIMIFLVHSPEKITVITGWPKVGIQYTAHSIITVFLLLAHPVY